jgi:hypothetical protein
MFSRGYGARTTSNHDPTVRILTLTFFPSSCEHLQRGEVRHHLSFVPQRKTFLNEPAITNTILSLKIKSNNDDNRENQDVVPGRIVASLSCARKRFL